MTAIPSLGYFTNSSLTMGGLKTGFEDLVASLRHVPWSGQIELTATISSGSVTPAGNGGVLVVDTEASAATDDLATIVATNYPNGAFLLLRNANAGRVVVVKHATGGSGTIALDRSVDYVLSDTKTWLLLRLHDNTWYELLRGPQRLQTEAFTKSATFTVAKQDIGKTFVCSGTYSINLPAAATVGNGFVFAVTNVGTGTLTIDPNASELVDGATTMAIPQGWTFQLVCTGTAWVTTDSVGPQVRLNPVVNGNMEIWQRGTSQSVTIANGLFTGPDRFSSSTYGTPAGVVNFNRSTNVPTLAQAGRLLNYSFEVDCTTAVTVSSSQGYYVFTNIIGGTWRQFSQRQFSIGFWVSSTKTGTYTLRLSGTSLVYKYLTSYTINAADTWEYKQFVIPPSVYWVGSLQISWVLAAGVDTVDPIQNAWHTVWVAGPDLSVSGQVNALDSTSNFFRLTGVRMELGSVITPDDVNSFEYEYLRCLRYYQKSFAYGTAPAQNVGTNTGEFIFPCPVGASTLFQTVRVPLMVPMEFATVNMFNPNSASGTMRNRTTSEDFSLHQTGPSGPRHVTLGSTSTAATSVGNTIAAHWIAFVSF